MMDVVPTGETGLAPGSPVHIETVVLGCGHVFLPDWDQGERIVMCPVDGQKTILRSRRRTVVSFDASPCPDQGQ